MVNFRKEGQVGDAVKHPRYGDGEIASLQGELAGYPVVVIFDGNAIDFTPYGRQHKGITPELCFANGSCDIDQGSPPERPFTMDGGVSYSHCRIHPSEPQFLRTLPDWVKDSDIIRVRYSSGKCKEVSAKCIRNNPDFFLPPSVIRWRVVTM